MNCSYVASESYYILYYILNILNHLTSIYETKSKKTYHYCYDFGIAAIEEGWFLIVEKLEDLD